MSKPKQPTSAESKRLDQMPGPPAQSNPFVEAMRMVSHIMTAICLMLASGGLGYAADWATGLKIFQFVGFIAGGYLALRYLIRITS